MAFSLVLVDTTYMGVGTWVVTELEEVLLTTFRIKCPKLITNIYTFTHINQWFICILSVGLICNLWIDQDFNY